MKQKNTTVRTLAATLTTIGSLAGGAMAQVNLDTTAFYQALNSIGDSAPFKWGTGLTESGTFTVTDATPGTTFSDGWYDTRGESGIVAFLELDTPNIHPHSVEGVFSFNTPADWIEVYGTRLAWEPGSYVTFDLGTGGIWNVDFNNTGLNVDIAGSLLTLENKTNSDLHIYDPVNNLLIRGSLPSGGINTLDFEWGGGAAGHAVFLRGPGVVPEPSSTALLGLGGLALILRRKRQASHV